MLKLPNAERGEEETLRPSEGADGRQFFHCDSRRAALPRTAPARLGLAGTARGLADGKMAGVVHAGSKSSFQASTRKGEEWSRGGME